MNSFLIPLQLIILSQCVLNTMSQFLPPMQPMPFPGLPPMPMPQGAMPSPMPQPLPAMPQILGPMPMPMIGQPKLPVVVMPYYSKSATENKRRKSKKRVRKRLRKRIIPKDSSDNSDSSSSSDEFNFRSSKNKGRRSVLTPVVSYVTKDGYVIYQKRIKKERARDWLELGRRKAPSNLVGSGEMKRFDSGEMTLRDFKASLRRAKRRRF